MYLCVIVFFSFLLVLGIQPLDEANLAELKVALNGFLAKGETIKLETKVGVVYICC